MIALHGGLLAFQLVQHIPHAKHVHDAQGTVIQAVAGTAVAGTLTPQVTAVVGTDVALKAAVVVSL